MYTSMLSQQASERSLRGRSTLLKKPLFSATRCDNLCNTLGTKNFPCFFFSSSILRQLKFLLTCDNFCITLGRKNFPCFFFLLLYWVSSKFCWHVTIFVTHWAQKTSLAFSFFFYIESAQNFFAKRQFSSHIGHKKLPLLFLLLLYWVSSKFCWHVTIFVTHWAQKTSLAFSFFFYIGSAQNSVAKWQFL